MKLLLKIISAASIIVTMIYMFTAIYYSNDSYAIVSLFALIVFAASQYLDSITKEEQ